MSPNLKNPLVGVERRLDLLKERLVRLKPLREKQHFEFDYDPYLRDVVERNLHICAMISIDLCHMIVTIEKSIQPASDEEALAIFEESGVLPAELVQKLLPFAKMRNMMELQYLDIDWDMIYQNLQNIQHLVQFEALLRRWISRKKKIHLGFL